MRTIKLVLFSALICAAAFGHDEPEQGRPVLAKKVSDWERAAKTTWLKDSCLEVAVGSDVGAKGLHLFANAGNGASVKFCLGGESECAERTWQEGSPATCSTGGCGFFHMNPAPETETLVTISTTGSDGEVCSRTVSVSRWENAALLSSIQDKDAYQATLEQPPPPTEFERAMWIVNADRIERGMPELKYDPETIAKVKEETKAGVDAINYWRRYNRDGYGRLTELKDNQGNRLYPDVEFDYLAWARSDTNNRHKDINGNLGYAHKYYPFNQIWAKGNPSMEDAVDVWVNRDGDWGGAHTNILRTANARKVGFAATPKQMKWGNRTIEQVEYTAIFSK